MNEINLQPVEKINSNQLDDLVSILNTDGKLIESLGNKKEVISNEEFIAHNKKWCKINKAKIYSIIRKTNAIGLISLSYIDIQNKEARIGYWITSKHWGKGYTTEAFKQVIDIAKENDIESVSCTISKENQSSKAIWQKFKAKFKEKDGKIFPLIKIA